MKKDPPQNIWHTGELKTNVETPKIHLIKSNLDLKMERDYVKIKLIRNSRSKKSDIYELKMALFCNGKPQDFVLFVLNFKTMVEASWMLSANEKIEYLRTPLHGEALC